MKLFILYSICVNYLSSREYEIQLYSAEPMPAVFISKRPQISPHFMLHGKLRKGHTQWNYQTVIFVTFTWTKRRINMVKQRTRTSKRGNNYVWRTMAWCMSDWALASIAHPIGGPQTNDIIIWIICLKYWYARVFFFFLSFLLKIYKLECCSVTKEWLNY